ncbi:hypothetical protein BS78_04G079100 [Paspalum vaginatum]|nr:hypothetical protein BS78_04G079100 [Paspalum vaginatum]
MPATLPASTKSPTPFPRYITVQCGFLHRRSRRGAYRDGRAAEVGADLQEVRLVGAGLGRAVPHRGRRRPAGAAALEERRRHQQRAAGAAPRGRGGRTRRRHGEAEAGACQTTEAEEPAPEAAAATGGGGARCREGVPGEGCGPGRRAAVAEGARLLRALRHPAGLRRRRWLAVVVGVASQREAVVGESFRCMLC